MGAHSAPGGLTFSHQVDGRGYEAVLFEHARQHTDRVRAQRSGARQQDDGGRCAPINEKYVLLRLPISPHATNWRARSTGNRTLISRWKAVRSKPNAGVTLDDVRRRRVCWHDALRLVAAGERRVIAEVNASGRHEGQSRLAQRWRKRVNGAVSFSRHGCASELLR